MEGSERTGGITRLDSALNRLSASAVCVSMVPAKRNLPVYLLRWAKEDQFLLEQDPVAKTFEVDAHNAYGITRFSLSTGLWGSISPESTYHQVHIDEVADAEGENPLTISTSSFRASLRTLDKQFVGDLRKIFGFKVGKMLFFVSAAICLWTSEPVGFYYPYPSHKF